MDAYLASILKANSCSTLVVGGVSDHVYALFVLSKNHSIANVVFFPACYSGLSYWNAFGVILRLLRDC